MTTWDGFWHYFYVMPFILYLPWVIFYGLCNFVLTDKVLNGTSDCTYKYFQKSLNLLPKSMSFIPRPIIFLFCHYLYFQITACISVILWHNYWLNIAMATFLMQWSVY